MLSWIYDYEGCVVNLIALQRRRWAPSTMANIMDLIGDWRITVKNNENISSLYIAYQV